MPEGRVPASQRRVFTESRREGTYIIVVQRADILGLWLLLLGRRCHVYWQCRWWRECALLGCYRSTRVRWFVEEIVNLPGGALADTAFALQVFYVLADLR